MKVGIGIDTHEIIDGDYMILAGVKIPCGKSILAHSDGDIVYHAIADAIYGCLSMGDIGDHFPDSDPSNKGLDSSKIISHAIKSLSNRKYKINNIDVVILLQSPKISQFKNDMKKNISKLTDCSSDNVNVKASTNENMGFVGEGKGISCHALVTIK